jgi:hypothetical protein
MVGLEQTLDEAVLQVMTARLLAMIDLRIASSTVNSVAVTLVV